MPSRRISKEDPPKASNSLNSTQLKCIKCVQTIFAKQYFQQLRLDFGTNYFDPYSKIFLEDVDVCEIDNQMKKEALIPLKEQRLDLFLHFMNKFVSSNRFVGPNLIQSILELILTINQKYEETSETTLRRIQSASLLFENILDNFPPSWANCSNFYKNLLYSPINMEIDFKKIRMNSSDGLFPIILALLDDVFKDTDNNEANTNGFDSMMNFQQFEQVESGKCCYTKLTRDEKIERLFIVLNLLVKLMEIDLSIWMQRNPFQTRNFLSNQSTCPLIAHLLWKGKNCGEINVMIRDVLKLFTMSIWIDFPNDKTDILARLVNLISVAITLSENCNSDNLINYPNIKRLTEALASEIVKSIEYFPYTIAFYINVISKMRSQIIRMLVSVRILSKFSKDFQNVSLRKIVDNILSGSYKQYAEKMDDDANRRRSSENYPTYDPKKDKKTSKHLTINRDEYLTLVLHLFESYIEVYRTHELKQSLMSDDKAVSGKLCNEQYKNIHQKVQNEKNHRMDFDQIAREWKQVKVAVKELANTDVMHVALLAECQNVYLVPSEFVRYREDLEYLIKLKEIIDENVELGDTFKQWRTAVNHYLSS